VYHQPDSLLSKEGQQGSEVLDRPESGWLQ